MGNYGYNFFCLEKKRDQIVLVLSLAPSVSFASPEDHQGMERAKFILPLPLPHCIFACRGSLKLERGSLNGGYSIRTTEKKVREDLGKAS